MKTCGGGESMGDLSSNMGWWIQNALENDVDECNSMCIQIDTYRIPLDIALEVILMSVI